MMQPADGARSLVDTQCFDPARIGLPPCLLPDRLNSVDGEKGD